MKKIILMVSILFSINLYGTDKTQCEELFRSAIFNFYLENSCKFDKHVSSAMRKKFGDKNCTELFSSDDMKRLNSEVLGDSYTNMNEVGRDKFCKNNKLSYDALANH
ncbi:MAG: hypothetical protein DRG78_22140 [Epsilonproteobacteria bacterium]|nr:MAG: hypothetical protein DRG78_22140 [Campylobacterota bacterium]